MVGSGQRDLDLHRGTQTAMHWTGGGSASRWQNEPRLDAVTPSAPSRPPRAKADSYMRRTVDGFCIQLPKISKPTSSGIPVPSCWGARGSPWSMRCLTIGGPAKPIVPDMPVVEKVSRKTRKPRAPKEPCLLPEVTLLKKKKEPLLTMSRDTSGKSFVSVNSISTSEGWRLPSYLGTQGKAQLEQLFGVLREELSMCVSAKEVEKVMKTAEKITSGGTADSFNMTGRLAYRFREAIRTICNNSSFVTLDCHHRLAFRKILKCEVKRRHAEIAGWDEKDAEEMALVTDMLDRQIPRRPPVEPPPHALQQVRRQLLEAVRESSPVEFGIKNSSIKPLSRSNSSIKIVIPPDPFLRSRTASLSKSQVLVELDEEPAMPKTMMGDEFEALKKSFGNSFRSMGSKEPAHSETPPPVEIPPPIKEEKPPPKPQDDEEKWLKVFNSVKEDTGIHMHDARHALGLVGFLKPDQGWIDEVFKSITKYITMKENEWIKFVRGYVERQHRAYREAFEKCDSDSSGEVGTSELVDLLKSFGIEPLQHVLQEVLDEVDTDGTGSLNLKEFGTTMELLRVREGFSKSEYDELVSLFKKCDRDGTGEIDAGEMAAVITWLGYICEATSLDIIIKSVDFDGSGYLNQTEFLNCMKNLRDNELTRIKEAVARNDNDGNGTVGLGELRSVFASVGYNVDVEAMLESGRDAGVIPIEDIKNTSQKLLKQHTMAKLGASSTTELDLSQLWRLMVVYRSREGFCAAESVELEGAFNRYDREDDGEVDSMEVGKMLRWLGYSPPFDLQQTLVRRVDVDDSGQLSFPEFRKLVRMLQGKEMEFVVDAFRQHDRFQTNFLPVDFAVMALKDAGCMDSNGVVPLLSADDLELGKDIIAEGMQAHIEDIQPTTKYISLDMFIRTANAFNKEARALFKKNSGFSEQEIVDMKESFTRFDRDGSGDIGSDELVRLIEDILPDIAHDPAMRPKLRSLVAEVDSDGSSSLDFQDFLRLMQQLQELKMQERIAKEHRAKQESSFSAKEVEEFRELFLASDEGTSMLQFESLKQMLGSICPLGAKNLGELADVVQAVVAKPVVPGAGHPEVDFPEFLKVMRKLLDTNFAGMRTILGDGIVAA